MAGCIQHIPNTCRREPNEASKMSQKGSIITFCGKLGRQSNDDGKSLDKRGSDSRLQ